MALYFGVVVFCCEQGMFPPEARVHVCTRCSGVTSIIRAVFVEVFVK